MVDFSFEEVVAFLSIDELPRGFDPEAFPVGTFGAWRGLSPLDFGVMLDLGAVFVDDCGLDAPSVLMLAGLPCRK